MIRMVVPAMLLLAGVGVSANQASTSTNPQQAFVDCEIPHPDGIEGTWRQDAEWTRREHLKAYPDVETPATISNGGAAMTITPDSYIVDIPKIGQIVRPYKLIGGSANRYLLELSDAQGESDVIAINIVPCGLFVENKLECTSAFCENGRDEAFQMIADKVGVSLEELKRSIEATEQPEQLPHRIYYRRVVSQSQ